MRKLLFHFISSLNMPEETLRSQENCKVAKRHHEEAAAYLLRKDAKREGRPQELNCWWKLKRKARRSLKTLLILKAKSVVIFKSKT